MTARPLSGWMPCNRIETAEAGLPETCMNADIDRECVVMEEKKDRARSGLCIRNPKIRLAEEKDVPRIRELMDLSVQNLPVREWFLDDDIQEIRKLIAQEGYTLLYEEACPPDPMSETKEAEEKRGLPEQAETVTAGFLEIKHPGLSENNLGRYLHLPDEELAAACHLESVSVDPAFRGRGIFRQLIAEALVLEREVYHMRHVLSTVHPDNIFSRRNMEEAGLEGVLTCPMYSGWMRMLMYRRL